MCVYCAQAETTNSYKNSYITTMNFFMLLLLLLLLLREHNLKVIILMGLKTSHNNERCCCISFLFFALLFKITKCVGLNVGDGVDGLETTRNFHTPKSEFGIISLLWMNENFLLPPLPNTRTQLLPSHSLTHSHTHTYNSKVFQS